jgi:hypothetical protein
MNSSENKLVLLARSRGYPKGTGLFSLWEFGKAGKEERAAAEDKPKRAMNNRFDCSLLLFEPVAADSGSKALGVPQAGIAGQAVERSPKSASAAPTCKDLSS